MRVDGSPTKEMFMTKVETAGFVVHPGTLVSQCINSLHTYFQRQKGRGEAKETGSDHNQS